MALFTRNFLGLLVVVAFYSGLTCLSSYSAQNGHLASLPDTAVFAALWVISVAAAIWANYPMFSGVQSVGVKLMSRSLAISVACVIFAFLGFLVNFQG
jgi:hypothetical protein